MLQREETNMRRCEEDDKIPTTLPVVVAGDTVKRTSGPYKGRIYLVTRAMRLISLEEGEWWSNSSLWGTSISGDWEKVDCCYKVLS